MVEHRHALTITESESADPCVATVLEERFIGNHGKHSHLDVVDEKKRSLVFCNACMETQRWIRHNSSNCQKAGTGKPCARRPMFIPYIYIYIYMYCIDSPAVRLAMEFLFFLCCLIDLLNDFN